MSEQKLKFVFKQILNTSPYTIYQVGIIASVVSGDSKYAFFSLLAFIFGDVFNFIEKSIFKRLMTCPSGNRTLGNRPSGCGNSTGENCTGCGIYPSSGRVSSTFGFPSGHAQILTLSSTFWTIYLVLKSRNRLREETESGITIGTFIRILLMWSFTIAVYLQRIISGCHSIQQVIMGSILGVFFGFLSYYIATLVYPELPKMTKEEKK